MNVLCPISADASSTYYGDSALASLIQVCECSLLVKSIMAKPKVQDARSIQNCHRPRAFEFIAKASRLGLLENFDDISRVVNSLCDDMFIRSGKELLNPRTRFKLLQFLKFMNHEYKGNRLSLR